MLEKIFKCSQHNTNVKTEILAGFTTFFTMAYIIFVQPAVLSTDFAGKSTGLDFGAVLLATCLASALTTFFMGLWSNYPIALAPGMGENFFFVSVIMALPVMGFSDAWTVALGIVFVAGLLFLVVSMFGIREAIINSMSQSMRNGIAVGIGLFITFIGLQHGGLVIAKPGTMVGLNTHFFSMDIALFAFGLVVMSVLMVRGQRGAILLGILASALLAVLSDKVEFEGLVGFPQIHATIAFKMDIVSALSFTCLPFIIVFFIMDMFDTVGTLVGVAEAGGFMQGDKLPRAQRVLIVDAVGTVVGACLGTSTITSYVESAAGIAAGGRTGLTSFVVGILFLLSLCFGPLIGMIGKYAPITAPALVIVGVMMIQNVKKIDWTDYSESIPSFLMIVGIPLSYSIADGLALGFISYPVIKVLSGRAKGVRWLMYVLAFLFTGYFVLIRSKLG